MRISSQTVNTAVKSKGSIFEIVYRRSVPCCPGHNQAVLAIAHRQCRLIWLILDRGMRCQHVQTLPLPTYPCTHPHPPAPTFAGVVILFAFEKPLCLVCLARQHRPVRRANTRCQLRGLPPVHLRFIHRTFGPVHPAVVDDSGVDPVLGHYQHLV